LRRFIISRTDNIGDVILTLPLAGFIKQHIPDSEVIFLGKKYTRPVVDKCSYVDRFIENEILQGMSLRKAALFLRKTGADTLIHVFPDARISILSALAGIKLRVGTSRRWHHRLFLNSTMPLSRRKSDMHEAALNLMLLKDMIPDFILPETDMIHTYYGFRKPEVLPEHLSAYIDRDRRNVIVHPKSKGSAREWGLDHFSRLIQLLPYDKYNVIIAGTDSEARLMEGFLKLFRARAHDVAGKLSLGDYITLIAHADVMVAASTGPLHIAAMAGIHTVGLYAPMKPIYPKRWAPIGVNAGFLVKEGECSKCRKSSHCECIRSIRPEDVYQKMEHIFYHS
jgi:ADP-heptose:LPS heptosyltransferase